jgi:hypothetical protein
MTSPFSASVAAAEVAAADASIHPSNAPTITGAMNGMSAVIWYREGMDQA